MGWRFWSDVERIKRCSALEEDMAAMEVNSFACTMQRKDNDDVFEQSLPASVSVRIHVRVRVHVHVL
jgi:hypothetical protein